MTGRVFGDGDYDFQINDFRSSNEAFRTKDKSEFLAKLSELTEGGAIFKNSVYESSLGGLLTPLMRVKMPKGLRIRHEYVVLEVRVGESEKCFVSLEKGQRGILAQLSSDEAKVSESRLDAIDGTSVEPRPSANLLSRVDMTDIKHLTKASAPTISDFMDFPEGDRKNAGDKVSFDIVPNYHLFKSNCQLFVIDVQNKIDLIAKSKEIRFSLPGSGGERVAIDDASVPQHLEKLYPRLAMGQLVEIPECSEKFLLVNDAAQPCLEDETPELKEKARFLSWKQRIYQSTLRWLKTAGIDRPKNGFYNVVFTNLSAEGIRAGMEFDRLPEMNVKGISEFWKRAFDILIFDANLGCLVVRLSHAAETDWEKRKAINQKIDILCALGDVGPETISHCSFNMSDPAPMVDEVLNSIFLAKQTSFGESSAKRIGVSQANRLVSQLVLLHRLEEDVVLLHDKFEKQIWGGAAMFSEEQHKIVDEVQTAFRKQSPVYKLIKGPMGSGKTLLLMKIARDYLRINPDKEKKVYLHILARNKVLIEQLRKLVAESEEMCQRVVVGMQPGIEREEWEGLMRRDLILIDEVEPNLASMNYRDLSLTQSLIVATSIQQIGSYEIALALYLMKPSASEFKEHTLSVSLRATNLLCTFVEAVREGLVGLVWMLPVISGVAVSGSPPDISYVSLPWKADKFFDVVVTNLHDLRNKYIPVSQRQRAEVVLVLVHGHSRLKMRIQKALIDQGIAKNIRFVEDPLFAYDSLGAQWPAVVVVVDGLAYLRAYFLNYYDSLLHSLTRSTSSISVIYHDSNESMPINGFCSLEFQHVFNKDDGVVKCLNRLSTETKASDSPGRLFCCVDDKKVADSNEIRQRVETEFKFEWNGSLKALGTGFQAVTFDNENNQKLRAKTKDAERLVEIESQHWIYHSWAPVVCVRIFEFEKDMKYQEKRDLDAVNKICGIFKQQIAFREV